jgi:sortase A
MRVLLRVPGHTRRWVRELARWTRNLLLVTGIVCVGWYVLDFAEAAVFQAYGEAELSAALKAYRGPHHLPPLPTGRGAPIGRLDIPRIGIRAMVLEGADSGILKLGVGHIPGSAFPGEPGNVSLAAHRDTFFRALRHIRRKDEIRLTTLRGVCRYQVEEIEIVDPTDTHVLLAGKKPSLTLITCYPFNYIGSAPDRFIVRARQITRSGEVADPDQ